jgi:hydroxyacylglutathione hydrolase
VIRACTLSTPELGDRSYLLHDGRVGAVIDPQRDVDRIIGIAQREGVRIACVAETHIHNDYVSGGWALAQHLGVPYLVAAAEEVHFERRPVVDGDVVEVGSSFSLRVVATPGHTPHHVSYVALEDGRPVSVCTGGSMLFGSAGRTDLSGDEATKPLAQRQYQSLHLLGLLPGAVDVLPTHGFGSFCSPGAAPDVVSSTIAQQRVDNLAFRMEGEDAFVGALMAGFTAYPSYYARMGGFNRRGVGTPDLSHPPAMTPTELRAASLTSAWVVDLRPRTDFAQSHLLRTINIEYAVPFTNYLGWLLPVDAPLMLMGESDQVVADAQMSLSRIGIDDIAGRFVGPLPPPSLAARVGSYPVRRFADLTEQEFQSGAIALDVRRQDEWAAGHLDESVHLPLHELVDHLDEIPPGTLWVHCAAGYRAGIAASLLERAGRQVVLIDGQFATREVDHHHSADRVA